MPPLCISPTMSQLYIVLCTICCVLHPRCLAHLYLCIQYSLHQDGTLHLKWVIIRFHSRKLIKNSFEGFLNDIGEHIKTASVRHSYGDIINKTTILFLPFWAFLCLSACHTSQQEPTSPADLWIVKTGGHLFMKNNSLPIIRYVWSQTAISEKNCSNYLNSLWTLNLHYHHHQQQQQVEANMTLRSGPLLHMAEYSVL
jgi:hypothetical protein